LKNFGESRLAAPVAVGFEPVAEFEFELTAEPEAEVVVAKAEPVVEERELFAVPEHSISSRQQTKPQL
jgi:hypothetical protein